ncbi:MAG: efflux RND transporter permease subunit [Kiritimatiellae bacterium]|nr:efflux RND transporter permease subunit [Kiritimatiellia bacterium]MCO5067391.1 CusA/CzcA family heavy metal efflux RND transporter [Kiritimatiellia bacterium]
MIKALIEVSLKQRPFVILAALALLVAGIVSALRLPIDAVPDITNIQVQVNTEVPALAPEEIEQLVTFPLEIELAGVPGMVELRSLSKFGLSQVTLIFEDGVDIYRARQLVSERLLNAAGSLPAGLTPKLAPISTGLGEVFYYTVEYASEATNRPATRHAQLMELTQIQEYVVKPRLRAVPGIAEVNTSGGYERQIVVMPKPERLLSVGITVSDLADIVAENVENAGGGTVQMGGEQIAIRTMGRVRSLAEIEALPIKFRAGSEPIRVSDVAEVGIGSSVRSGASTWNGEECVLGSTMMLAGENSRVVARRVAAALDELRERMPEGVELVTGYDRTALVDRTIATVEKNLAEGAILVMVILFLLLGNYRAALIVSLAIPLSFLFAITGMLKGGISGNLMSLGAVDFGLIIDGAVVMVENTVRRLGLRQRECGRILTKRERLDTVRDACVEVGTPTFFGVLIITIVYLPILALTGIEGKMFRPMGLTVMMALVGALLLSLTLMPVLCSFFLGGRIRESDGFFIGLSKRLYAPALRAAFRLRWLVVVGAIAIFAWSGSIFQKLGAEFVPQLDEGSFATHMIRTTSIGLDASIEMQRKAERILLDAFPEVSHTFSRIGTSEVATDPMGVNVADSYIFLKPREMWRNVNGRPISKDALADLMSRELSARAPGQAYLFSQPIEMRFNEILEGTRADISVKVFGEDYAIIERIAGEVRELLEKIPGAADVELDALGRSPVLEIAPHRDAMTHYNLHAAEINSVVEHALAGEEVGLLIEGDRRAPIVVRLAEDARNRIEVMKELPLRTEDGGLLRLGQVAEFAMEERVSTIVRESARRRAAIMVNLRGRDVEGFVEEARARVAESIELPPGYFIEFGGAFKNLQEARARLAVIVPAALLVIFILIFFAFKSIRQALVVYTGIPLAATGGIISLWLRGMPFSISAAVGFIALSGVAVLNGVVMITYFNQLRQRGRSVQEAVAEGALARLRPVLMTALVASFGFVPMALAQGAGAEVQRPLATVVIGGILTSTFLTLILLPTLYRWAEQRIEQREESK